MELETLGDPQDDGHGAFSVPSKSKCASQHHISKPSQVQMVAHATCGINRLYYSLLQNKSSTENRSYTDKDGHFISRSGFVLGKRFKIVSQVQASGQSAVLVNGQDLYRNKMEVVIKILHESYFAVGLKEIQTLRHLSSSVSSFDGSHIIPLLSALRFGNHICLVFPAYSPLPLTQIFKGKHLDLCPQQKLSRIRKITLRLLSALAFMNQQRIIHSDLKPENILMNKDEDIDSIVVADFGNAIFHVHKEMALYYSDFELQTLPYRAPEIFVGIPFSVEIDMWSLGSILAELFLSRPLFTGDSRATVLKQVMALLGPLPPHMWMQGTFSEELQMMMAAPEEDTPCSSHSGFGDSTVWRLMTKLPALTDYTFASFLSGLLALDPNKRLSPFEALQHPFIAKEFCVNFLLPDSKPHSGVINCEDYKLKQDISQNVKRMCPSTFDILRVGTSDARLCTYVKHLQQDRNKQVANEPPLFDQGSHNKFAFQSQKVKESERSERPLSAHAFNEIPQTHKSKLPSSPGTSKKNKVPELSCSSKSRPSVFERQSNNSQIGTQTSDSTQQPQQGTTDRKGSESDASIGVEATITDETAAVPSRMSLDSDKSMKVSPCAKSSVSNETVTCQPVPAGKLNETTFPAKCESQIAFEDPTLQSNKGEKGDHEMGSKDRKRNSGVISDGYIKENSSGLGITLTENETLMKTEPEVDNVAFENTMCEMMKVVEGNETTAGVRPTASRNISLSPESKHLNPARKKKETDEPDSLLRPSKRKCSLNATYGEKIRYMYCNDDIGRSSLEACVKLRKTKPKEGSDEIDNSMKEPTANITAKKRRKMPKANDSDIKPCTGKNQSRISKKHCNKSQRSSARSNKATLCKAEISSPQIPHGRCKKEKMGRKNTIRNKHKTHPVKQSSDVSEINLRPKELDLFVNIQVALEQKDNRSHKLQISSGCDGTSNQQPHRADFCVQNKDNHLKQIINFPAQGDEDNARSRSRSLKDASQSHRKKLTVRRALWKSSEQSTTLENDKDKKRHFDVVTGDQGLPDENGPSKRRKRLLSLTPATKDKSRSDPYEFKVTPQREGRSPTKRKRKPRDTRPSHSRCKKQVKVFLPNLCNNTRVRDNVSIHALVQRKSEQFFGLDHVNTERNGESNMGPCCTLPNPEKPLLHANVTNATKKVNDITIENANKSVTKSTITRNSTENVQNTIIGDINSFNSEKTVTLATASVNNIDIGSGTIKNTGTESIHDIVTGSVNLTIKENVQNTNTENDRDVLTGRLNNFVTENIDKTVSENVNSTVTGNVCKTVATSICKTVTGDAFPASEARKAGLQLERLPLVESLNILESGQTVQIKETALHDVPTECSNVNSDSKHGLNLPDKDVETMEMRSFNAGLEIQSGQKAIAGFNRPFDEDLCFDDDILLL